ncbi:hypothetical protein BAUCODRAFT_43405, partial [Baudoinia panamericana UAMH 10762]
SNNQGLYDPHPSDSAQGGRGLTHAEAVQREINDVTNIVRQNLQATSQRGERLDNLENKTNALSGSANQFRTRANRVRKDMWWKDMKMRMCIIIAVIILLVVIIVPS